MLSRAPGQSFAVVVWAGLGLGVSACSASTGAAAVRAAPVAAASPPKDDGQSSKGGAGGAEHAAALEELKIAPLSYRGDRQNSVRLLLPDGPHWTRVKFWGLPSLVGFRYGKDHHAIVAAFVTHVDPPAAGAEVPVGACGKSFEAWAAPWVQAFEVDLQRDAPSAVMWSGRKGLARTRGVQPEVVDIESLYATVATALVHDGYASAYATFPVWPNACLVVGVAVPAREDEARAREVRDRFTKEALPRVLVLSADAPKDME